MLSQSKSTGVIAVRRSCADRPQTSHRPQKEYSDSPKKADSFKCGAKQPSMFDDPRLSKYRNSTSYRDHVRNITINYCSSASKDITSRYLFERASLSSAARDHDYLDKPFTEYWVERALKMADDQAADLESKTRKQAKGSLWHEERRWRLTASQFATICKCTTRRNKTKLCKQIVSGRKLVCNSVRHGLQQEPKAVAKLEIACNVQVHSFGMFVDSELP